MLPKSPRTLVSRTTSSPPLRRMSTCDEPPMLVRPTRRSTPPGKRENEFRAGQRKAGKSRKGNLKDPNAPKKPLSAYFLFLKAIRSNRALTRIVFEDAEATTKQSTLAAMRWREFTPEQKAVSGRVLSIWATTAKLTCSFCLSSHS
jgi:hypothetical protein